MKIRKDLPLPQVTRSGRRTYPFDDMEVGACLELPIESAQNLRTAASRHAKKSGKRFTVQAVPDEGVVRCWRLE